MCFEVYWNYRKLHSYDFTLDSFLFFHSRTVKDNFTHQCHGCTHKVVATVTWKLDLFQLLCTSSNTIKLQVWMSVGNVVLHNQLSCLEREREEPKYALTQKRKISPKVTYIYIYTHTHTPSQQSVAEKSKGRQSKCQAACCVETDSI